MSLRALTVRQPWAWGLLNGKPCENRTWAPPADLTEFALHAGARSRWDASAVRFPPMQAAWEHHIRSIPAWPGLPYDDVMLSRKTALMPFGAIVAVAAGIAWHHADDCNHCSPWAAPDQYHWCPAGLRPLAEPVPCKGALGLWRVPDDIERAVRAQLEESNG